MDKRSWIDLFGVKHSHLNDNPQYLGAQIGRAFNHVLGWVFRNDYTNLDLYTKDYYGIAIEQDSHGNYYSTLPARLMQFPEACESVRRITAEEDQRTILFVAVPKDSWSTFALLDVDKVSVYVPYSVSNNRVEYAKNPKITTVSMGLVRNFADYEDDEEIPVPSGQEMLWEQLVESFINGTPIPDKINM